MPVSYTHLDVYKRQAKKYYQDCFGKIDKEVNRLTGTLEEFDYETIIQYYNRIIDDKNRYCLLYTSRCV